MFVHVLYTCSDVLHLAVWHSRVRDVAKHQSVGRTSPLWWACTSLIHFQWNHHFKLCVICMSLALIIHHPSAFQENPCWEQSTKSSSRYSSWSHCVQGGQNQNWYCEAEARVNYIGKHAKRLTIDENITDIISYQSKLQAASSCRVPKFCSAHPSQGQAAGAPVQAAPRAAPSKCKHSKRAILWHCNHCRSSLFSVIFSWEFARLFVTGQIWGRCCIAKTSRIPAAASY